MMRLTNIEIHADGQMRVTLLIPSQDDGPRTDFMTYETWMTYLDRLTLKEIEHEVILKVGKAVIDAVERAS